MAHSGALPGAPQLRWTGPPEEVRHGGALIGYARCSTDQQDLTAQRDGLTALGAAPARVYVDHGLTGDNRDRPGLRESLAACREDDTPGGDQARPTRTVAARRPGDR